MVTVSFTTSTDLSDVVVRVIPELTGIVSVDPVSIGDVGKGETVSLSVTIAPPIDALPETLDGVIQLRRGGRPPKVYAPPLPITVHIWRPAEITSNGVTVGFAYPPEWDRSGGFLYRPETPSGVDELTPPEVTIQVLENASLASLRDFLANYRRGWYLLYDEISELTIGSHPAILTIASTTPREPASAAFIAVPSAPAIVSVLGRKSSQEEFFEVLELLVLP